MKKIVIFGSGFHAKAILFEVLQLKKFNCIGFVDFNRGLGELIVNINNKIYKTLDPKILKNFKIKGVVGIGDNFYRKQTVKFVEKNYPKVCWQTIISKNSAVSTNVKVGEGSVIISGCVINNSTIIGKHCIVNTSCSIDHDNCLADYVSLSPRITTGGNVSIGLNSFIGISSTIKNNIKIEKNIIIGAFSYVNKNCSSNKIYYGNPARFIKKLKHVRNYLK